MIQSHSEAKFLNGLENLVCNKTSIFANAKILEESNPRELIALKCRTDYFLNVQHSIIYLINICVFWSSGQTLLFGKGRSILVKDGKTLRAIGYFFNSQLIFLFQYSRMPIIPLYILLLLLFKVSLLSAAVKDYSQILAAEIGYSLWFWEVSVISLPQQLIWHNTLS